MNHVNSTPEYSLASLNLETLDASDPEWKWAGSLEHSPWMNPEFQRITTHIKQNRLDQNMSVLDPVGLFVREEPPVRSNKSWMMELYQRFPRCRTLPLAQWVIPGSHNSAACTSKCTPQVSKPLSQTQERGIGQQLEDGIRYLDIRCQEVNGHFYGSHSAVFETRLVNDVLEPIVRFLQQPESQYEVLLLDTRMDDRFTMVSNDTVTALYTLILNHLSMYLLQPVRFQSNWSHMTLQNIYTSRCRIILLSHHYDLLSESHSRLMWKTQVSVSSNIFAYANQAYDVATMIDFIQKRKSDIPLVTEFESDTLHVFNISVSCPNQPVGIQSFGFGKFVPSLKIMTSSISPILSDIMRYQTTDPKTQQMLLPPATWFNVILSDFYHMYPFVTNCMAMNIGNFESIGI